MDVSFLYDFKVNSHKNYVFGDFKMFKRHFSDVEHILRQTCISISLFESRVEKKHM